MVQATSLNQQENPSREVNLMPKCSDCGFLNQTIVGFKMEVDNEPSYSCLKELTPSNNINEERHCEGYIKYTAGVNDYFKYEEELKERRAMSNEQ
ncbi:MAG: hypothetical protein HY097_11550 [Nitrospinae bacterium]|nr:hypothetical protein [Nitrospinota bacterium]MBI3815145.1 hypothetical protein [Nitrospinota bacterium]